MHTDSVIVVGLIIPGYNPAVINTRIRTLHIIYLNIKAIDYTVFRGNGTVIMGDFELGYETGISTDGTGPATVCLQIDSTA